MSNPTLAPIYDRLAGTENYHPFTADTFADWTSEPGDTVRISRNGQEYAAPIHAQTLVWRGKTTVQMESAGTKDREPIERTSNRKYNGTSAGQSNERTTAGMMGGLVADNKHLLYVVEDPQNGLVHKFEVTAEALTSEITRATQAESGLQVDISSLEQDISGVRTTVGTIEGQVVTMAGTLTSITGSALWTQRNEITGVVGEFAVIETGGTKTLVVKSGGGLKIRRDNVEYGVYDDGTLTAGVIATKVNGTPSTYIYADKILMSSASGANTVQVEVNGKITAQDITANYIQAKISELVVLSAASISCGSIDVEGTSSSSTVETGNCICDYLNGNDADNVIVDASVSGNTLTLTKSDGTPITFSKATTLSGAWSGRYYTVTASPQGVSKSGIVYDGIVKDTSTQPTVSGKNVRQYFIVYSDDGSGDADTQILRKEVSIDASGVWDAAEAQFTAVSLATIKNTSAIRIDDTAVTLYEAGSGTIYDRGESVLGRETLSSGGYMYYPAGTATTYYNAGSGTKYDRGTSVTAREVVSSGGTIYYTAASAVTYYRGNGGTVTQTNQKIDPVYTGGPFYIKSGTNTYTQVANAGTGIYPSQSSLYTSGGQVTLRGDEVTVTPISSTSAIRLGSSGTYYRGNGGGFTPQGTSVSVTPISSSLGIRLSAQQTYYRGNGGAYTPQGTAQDAYKKVASGGTIYYQANAQATYYTKQ